MTRILFAPGRIVATPGAIDATPEGFLLACLQKHLTGDWGTVPPEDAQSNNDAVRDGQRVLSSYLIDESRAKTSDNALWVITEWDRSVTTFLLPSEY